jgi:putative tricarboxylic transport membrane protein
MKKKIATGLVLGLLLVSTVAGCANKGVMSASKFPTKPITILNSSAAGSPTDVLAREVARQAEKTLGQSMVVENATGGGGGVMMAKLLKEPADGYTIAGITAAQVAALQSELKKDFKFEDFEFLVNVQNEPYAIAVNSDSPYKSIKEMMDFAKANPGKLKVGGQGTGSSLHLIMLQLADATGSKITWVPFAGGSESVTNLLGKNVDVISTAPATVNQYIEAGKIRVLAVTGEKRMDSLKDVPTLSELGFKDIQSTQYRGFFAKKGLPADVKSKIVDALTKATKEPTFKEYMAKNKQPDGYMGPDDFAKLAKKDFDQVGQLSSKYLK